MRFSGKALSLLLSVVLVVGLCPGLAYAGGLVPAGISTGETFLDASDSVLQAGGLNKERPAASGSGLSVQAATNVAGFEAALAKAADKWNGEEKISVDVSSYKVTSDNLWNLYVGFCNRNAQYFYLTGGCSYFASSDGLVSQINMNCNTSFSKSDVSKFSAASANALSGIEDGWSDEQIALYLHDWVVTHCEYDLTYSRYTAYDVLVTGSAVCQGYALAYDYLLGKAGVKCDVITSKGIDHAWNLVTVGGKTYYADCTWDDPAGDDPTGVYREGYCEHGDFLRSKSAFGHTGDDASAPKTDWVDTSGANVYKDSKIASSTNYDSAYWVDVESAIPHVGDLWAYVKAHESGSTATVRVHDYSSGEDSVLATGIDGKWPVFGGSANWIGHFTNLVSNGASFLVTTPTSLVKVEVDKTTQVVYSLTSAEKAKGYIYSLSRDASNGKCRYQICEGPLGKVTGSGTYSYPTVVVAVTGVSLKQGVLSLWRGSTVSVVATVAPVNATNRKVVWSSANEKIATVDSSGRVKGIAAGTTVITAKTKDGGFKATRTVTVKTTALNKTNTTIAKVAAKTYKGSAFTPTPTVKFGTTTLKLGTDYRLCYSKNIKAGTATVTVKGINRYAGSLSKNFTISKAANPMNVVAKTATVSYSKGKAQAVKAGAAYNFKKKAAGAVTYARVASGSSKWLPKVNPSTGAITVKAGAPKGKTQSVKVKVTAKGNENYRSFTKTVTVKVKVK